MTPTDALIDRALKRNEAYLRAVVEAHELCPFAHRCRESGRLERRVLTCAAPDEAGTVRVIEELSSPAFEHVEVALLIFPALDLGFAAFERFVSSVRDRARGAAYYAVAFHPDSPPEVDSPARVHSLLRRSPDPTIQLVRASLLERLRGPDLSDTVFLDPATHPLDAPLPPRPRSLTERISDANWETVQRIGAQVLLRQLDELRR